MVISTNILSRTKMAVEIYTGTYNKTGSLRRTVFYINDRPVLIVNEPGKKAYVTSEFMEKSDENAVIEILREYQSIEDKNIYEISYRLFHEEPYTGSFAKYKTIPWVPFWPKDKSINTIKRDTSKPLRRRKIKLAK